MDEQELDSAFSVMQPFMKETISSARDEVGENALASEGLAEVCLNEGDFIGAAAHYRRAIEQEGPSGERLFGLGASLEGCDDPEGAEAAWIEAMRLSPNAESAAALADLVRSEGRQDEALGWLQQAVEMNPRWPFLYIRIADIHRNSGRRREAADAMDRAAELDGQNSAVMLMAAEAWMNDRRWTSATSAAQELIDQDPTNLEARYILAVSGWNSGNHALGIQAVREALEVAPDRLDLAGVLEALLRSEGHTEAADKLKAQMGGVTRFDQDQIQRRLLKLDL